MLETEIWLVYTQFKIRYITLNISNALGNG